MKLIKLFIKDWQNLQTFRVACNVVQETDLKAVNAVGIIKNTKRYTVDESLNIINRTHRKPFHNTIVFRIADSNKQDRCGCPFDMPAASDTDTSSAETGKFISGADE